MASVSDQARGDEATGAPVVVGNQNVIGDHNTVVFSPVVAPADDKQAFIVTQLASLPQPEIDRIYQIMVQASGCGQGV
ncbi:hypothetical protein HKX42_00055 [Salinisphaera sp. USBA-960]|nr:hypothetical protein [Salifodinibacter halophilus]NNC25284.1 hypothetical protein [Salifodinibacter halophilus]